MQKIPKIPLKEFQSYADRSKYLYKIRTENNKIVGFALNEAQAIIEKIRNEEFERNLKYKGTKQAKLLFLKGRQEGVTTETAIFNIDLMLNLMLAQGIILAHDDKSTPVIYQKYRFAYNRLPEVIELVDDDGNSILNNDGEPLYYNLKPEVANNSGYQLAFSDKTESRVIVRTAGSGDSIGRGDTLNFIHLCLGENTKIVLSDGSTKEIKNVNIGDKIITSSGSIAKIKNKFDTGKKKTYILKTWLSNEEIYPSKDHKILTIDGYKTLENLTKDDYIALPKIKFTNEIKEYSIDLNKNKRWSTAKKTKHTFKLNYDFGYLIGYYLAEGHVKKESDGKNFWFSGIEFAHNKNENYVDKIIEDFGNLSTSISQIDRKNSLTRKTFFYGSLLATTMNEICGRVENKHIPEWFFKTNEDFIYGVITGYFDGDGSKTQSIQKVKNRKKEKWTSPEIIYNELKNIENGKSISKIAKEYKLTYQTVWKWTKKFKNLSLEEIKNKSSYYGKDKYYLKQIIATSIREKITRQLKRLVLGLNIGVPSVYFKKNIYRYDKQVSDKYMLGLFGKTVKNIKTFNRKGNIQEFTNKYKFIDNVWYVRVKSIKKNIIEQTYDIEVDHTDHNFETVSGIVSNSEAARYDHYDDIMTAVNQAFPKSAEGYCAIESTAFGISGKGEGFYREWLRSSQAWEKYESGKSETFEGYRPVFLPWYIMPKYRIPLVKGKLISLDGINWRSDNIKKDFINMEEKLIEEIFHDDRIEGLEAINWYRYAIKELCQHDIMKAKQEYPTIPEDAFLSTDVCFFDTPSLFQVMKRYESGELPNFKIGNLNEEFEFKEETFGALKIWEEPQEEWENRYIISLDPAAGIEEGDFSCMMVFDRLEKKFVAKWYGDLKEDLLAEEFMKLGYYYNNALLIPETNLRTVVTLIEPDGLIPYKGPIYQQFLKSRGAISYGFNTNGESRKKLLDFYAAFLRDNYDKIMDKEILREHMMFVKKVKHGGSSVKYEATLNEHDDQVMASALCILADIESEEEIYKVDEKNKDSTIITPNKRKRIKLLRQTNLNKQHGYRSKSYSPSDHFSR